MEKQTLRSLLLISFILFPTLAVAQEIIDLGTLEVKGEVRQPQVQFYSSQEIPKKVLKSAAEKGFESFERELLAPLNSPPRANQPENFQDTSHQEDNY